MKKRTIQMILLLLIPLIVVGIALSPRSVTVFDGETVRKISFYTTVPESPGGWCAPVAALLNYGLFGAAVLFAVTKKKLFLKACFGLSFVTLFVSMLPVIVQNKLHIVPSALVGILFAVQCGLSFMMLRKPEDQASKEQDGPRLDGR